MSDWTAYKQIIGYFEQLNGDIGQLAVLIERLMEEEDFESLPSAGTRSSYGLTSNYSRSDYWWVRYITRCFVPREEEQYAWSVFYLINLTSESAFDFPAVVCGRMEHDFLSESQIYNRAYLVSPLRALTHKNEGWTALADEGGFSVAEPTFKTPTRRVKGYILNLFELSDRQKVMENIIKPLTTIDEESNLQEMITIPTYRFGNLPDLDMAD